MDGAASSNDAIINSETPPDSLLAHGDAGHVLLDEWRHMSPIQRLALQPLWDSERAELVETTIRDGIATFVDTHREDVGRAFRGGADSVQAAIERCCGFAKAGYYVLEGALSGLWGDIRGMADLMSSEDSEALNLLGKNLYVQYSEAVPAVGPAAKALHDSLELVVTATQPPSGARQRELGAAVLRRADVTTDAAAAARRPDERDWSFKDLLSEQHVEKGLRISAAVLSECGHPRLAEDAKFLSEAVPQAMSFARKAGRGVLDAIAAARTAGASGSAMGIFAAASGPIGQCIGATWGLISVGISVFKYFAERRRKGEVAQAPTAEDYILRVIQDLGALRNDMREEFSQLRVEMKRQFGDVFDRLERIEDATEASIMLQVDVLLELQVMQQAEHLSDADDLRHSAVVVQSQLYQLDDPAEAVRDVDDRICNVFIRAVEYATLSCRRPPLTQAGCQRSMQRGVEQFTPIANFDQFPISDQVGYFARLFGSRVAAQVPNHLEWYRGCGLILDSAAIAPTGPTDAWEGIRGVARRFGGDLLSVIPGRRELAETVRAILALWMMAYPSGSATFEIQAPAAHVGARSALAVSTNLKRLRLVSDRQLEMLEVTGREFLAFVELVRGKSGLVAELFTTHINGVRDLRRTAAAALETWFEAKTHDKLMAMQRAVQQLVGSCDIEKTMYAYPACDNCMRLAMETSMLPHYCNAMQSDVRQFFAPEKLAAARSKLLFGDALSDDELDMPVIALATGEPHVIPINLHGVLKVDPALVKAHLLGIARVDFTYTTSPPESHERKITVTPTLHCEGSAPQTLPSWTSHRVDGEAFHPFAVARSKADNRGFREDGAAMRIYWRNHLVERWRDSSCTEHRNNGWGATIEAPDHLRVEVDTRVQLMQRQFAAEVLVRGPTKPARTLADALVALSTSERKVAGAIYFGLPATYQMRTEDDELNGLVLRQLRLSRLVPGRLVAHELQRGDWHRTFAALRAATEESERLRDKVVARLDSARLDRAAKGSAVRAVEQFVEVRDTMQLLQQLRAEAARRRAFRSRL